MPFLVGVPFLSRNLRVEPLPVPTISLINLISLSLTLSDQTSSVVPDPTPHSPSNSSRPLLCLLRKERKVRKRVSSRLC